MQMTLEEAIGYVAADELIEASIVLLILQTNIPIKIPAFGSICVRNGTNGHEHCILLQPPSPIPIILF